MLIRLLLTAGSLAVIFMAALLVVARAQEPAKVNPKDGAEMVWVPAGEFLMGSMDADIAKLIALRPKLRAALFDDEKPQHKVYLDGYWIYRYTVTVAQYRKFCAETGRKLPEQPDWSTDKYPVVNVNWYDAAAYAQWAGAHLPTEAQWEKAARGTDARQFPWGNEWNEEKCNGWSDTNPIGKGVNGKCATPGGSYPQGASPYGVQDMAGNVWEWCRDYYAQNYYARSPAKNPTGPETGEFRVMRGGAWGSSSVTVRAACRHWETPDATYHDDGGFRCVVPGEK
jgi:iron(II)-dependent oxidoreductase